MTEKRKIHRQSGRPAQAGFTLLLAALAASIALVLGTAIFSISQKEIQLSSIGRNSQFAFYAADTAAECGLYWDMRYSYFGTSTPANVVAPQPQCEGQTLKAPDGSDLNLQRPPINSPAPYPYTMRFQLESNGYCAIVAVEKCDGPIAANGSCTHVPPAIRTVVHADGFNTSCANISTSQTALQRSIELNY